MESLQVRLEGALMFLSASVGSRYLLRHGSEAYALVFVQVVLVHIFYTLSRVAHEHKHRHLLAYRAPVRMAAGAAAVVLPAALGVRCPVHDVDIPMVLLVMFAGEVLGCLAVVVAAVLVVGSRGRGFLVVVDGGRGGSCDGEGG